MSDLEPITALGANTPRSDSIGGVTITENDGLALASVAARHRQVTKCAKLLGAFLGGSPPGPGKARLADPVAGFWIGPDQWMIGAPLDSHESLADDLKAKLGDTASVTEQTGAWACFDVTGAAMPDLCERLCNVPIRTMQAGDAQRTLIHHLGCFVIRRTDADHIRILGPRASAGSLHHALIVGAQSL